jgi:hypothetical protein
MENRPSLALENISLGVIVKIVCDQMQLSHDKIPSDSQSRRVSLARSMVAYFAHYHAKYSYEDIAAVVCRTPNSIGKTLRRYLKLASSDREIRSLLNGIEKNCQSPIWIDGFLRLMNIYMFYFNLLSLTLIVSALTYSKDSISGISQGILPSYFQFDLCHYSPS